MIAILPLILLLVRRSHFSKLTLTDLPLLSEDELHAMKKASNTAIVIFVAFTVLSIALPVVVFPDKQQDAFTSSLVVTVIGLVTAGIFDLKAEQIKKRGRKPAALQKEDQVRWYHVIVSLLIPVVGLPWGITNLFRKKKKSGITMIIISSIMLLSLILPVILAPE